MYKVRYYNTAGPANAKVFKTLTEAIHFSVYSVYLDNLIEIVKVEE